MHAIKAAKDKIISAKNTAPIDNITAIKMDAISKTIDKATNEKIIVPIVPTNKHIEFVQIHFATELQRSLLARNTPATNIIRDKTPNPKAIQTAVTIFGIKPSAKRVPTSAPKAILINMPRQLQALKLFL